MSRQKPRVLKSQFQNRLVECRLGQAKVDDFRCHSASLLQTHHDVAWFDVPVNELLFVHRSQTGGDLRRNFQRQLYLKPTVSV